MRYWMTNGMGNLWISKFVRSHIEIFNYSWTPKKANPVWRNVEHIACLMTRNKWQIWATVVPEITVHPLIRNFYFLIMPIVRQKEHCNAKNESSACRHCGHCVEAKREFSLPAFGFCFTFGCLRKANLEETIGSISDSNPEKRSCLWIS